jgi:ATP-binding cassette, subfamily D (ALD), peroxisomal long-chain fatty acid import protein
MLVYEFILYRPSLMKYHTRLLTLIGDGSGRWSLTRVGTEEERMGIDREIISLKNKLGEVDEWERRLKELDGLLSAQEPE